jgi:hypothetical protein
MTNASATEPKINIRIVLSALWTSILFCYIYGDYFELYVPGKTAGLVNGQNLLNSPLKLFITTFILTVPALMISLCLTLKAKLASWLNIIVGLFFTIFTLLVGITSLSEWRIFYVFLSFVESILTTIVVIKAWNWSKQ